MKRKSLVAVFAFATLTLSACSSVDLSKDNMTTGADTPSIEAALNSKDGPLAQKSVYFDFDSYTISPEYLPVVTNHAKFLSVNKNLKVTLEGNTDERGGREYNLALGQKRAEAVKQRMTLLGVSPDQIETVSFGKEKPVAFGQDEESYSLNRRVDIRYTLPTN
ncbi:MAG: peptidoglycan-associated lipoprotein Pal [Burkholderiaceae bacterium]|nr:peptidoglycan-associated lipoprotein Pal [Burkholderiaceae bacterium]